MSTDTRTTPVPAEGPGWITYGLVSGAIVGVGLGLVFWALGEMAMLGELIGMPTVLGGWLLHLVLSFGIMLVFAAALASPWLGSYADSALSLLVLGLAYGVVLWVVLDGFILAYLAQSAGFEGVTVPAFPLAILVEDLVIGLIVGLVYFGT